MNWGVPWLGTAKLEDSDTLTMTFRPRGAFLLRAINLDQIPAERIAKGWESHRIRKEYQI